MRALLAALLALPSAVLAPPALAAGDGSLTRAGCVTTGDQAGCVHARALGDPRDVAVSPGGGSVYVTSAGADAVAVFGRNRRTSALRQLRGRAGCVRNKGGRGCRRARALRDPSAVVVSPDGRNVYVASARGTVIAIFRRNRRTGSLRRPAVAGSPVTTSLTLSPDGRYLYAGTGTGVGALRRNTRTGRLRRLRITSDVSRNIADVVVDPAGNHLYASSPGAKAVAVYDLARGVPRPASCISDSGEGCTAARALNGAFGLAISPDGRQLYTAAEFSGAIAVLARDAASGALSQQAGPLGCIRDGGGLDCSEARFMGHPDFVEVSGDGRNVYVRADGGLVVLRRNRVTGELSQLPGRRGCIARGNPDCTESAGFATGAMALSRDGRNLYVTSEPGLPGGAVAIYRRAD